MASRCKTDTELLELINQASSPKSAVSKCLTSLSGETMVKQTRIAGKTLVVGGTATTTGLPIGNPESAEEAIDMPDTSGVDIKSDTTDCCQYSTDLETANHMSENAVNSLSSFQSCEKYATSDDLPEMQVTEPIKDFTNVDTKYYHVKNDDNGEIAAPSLPKEIDSKLGISKIIAVKNKTSEGNVENSMIKDEDLWCLSKEELIAELRSCREQVVSLKKQLSKSERQVKKANDYNEVLRSSLEKVSSQVHSYKTAKFTEAAIQVDKMDLLNYTTGEPCMPDWGSDMVNVDTEALQSDSYHSVEDQTQKLASDEAPMSLADSIKMAAQETLDKQTQDTMLLQGYVFDENYGLYYHSESGYYYDQEKQLYYDPNSGIYYYYDYNTGQYAFHSQVSSFAGDAFTVYRDTDTTNKKVNQKKMGKKPKKAIKLPTPEEGYKNRRERRKALKEKKEKEKVRRLERKREKKLKENSRLIEDQSVRGDVDRQRSRERRSISSGSRSQSERTLVKRNNRKRRKYNDEDFNSGDWDIGVSEKRNKHKKKKHRKERSENESDSDDKNKSIKRRKHAKRKHKKSRHRDVHYKEDKQGFTDDAKKRTDDSEAGIEDNINLSDPDQLDHQFIILEANKDDGEQNRIITDSDMEKERKKVIDNSAKTAKDSTDNPFIHESDSTHTHVDFDEDNSGTLNGTTMDQSHDSSSHESGKGNSESIVSSEESGEVTDSSSTGESDDDSDDSSETESGDNVYIVHDFEEYGEQVTEQEVAQSWPPCVRVIVTESDFVAVGMLYIVTYQGATIGREKENGICIPDINISKCHAEIRFAENDNLFTIIDKGSQNGTFLNEERISMPKQTSEAKAFKHGDVIQVAGTKLLCHIHSGTDTCDECEPGIVMAKYRQQQPKQEVKFISKEERKKIQKKELNEIKKRYGLKNAAFEVRSDVLNNPNYEDKAAERRKTVGSDVPTVVKEAPASVFRPISSENKGHKMLEKMGWKEGESLGKDNSGIQEPIAVSLRVNQSAGLGSASAGIFSAEDANSANVRKANRRIRAMQRYDDLEMTERVANQLSERVIQKVEYASRTTKKLPEKYKMSWSQGDTENT